MSTETITWVACSDRLPDADLILLVFDSETATVMEAFLEGEDDDGRPLWRDVTAVPLEDVTHWAEMPQGPTVAGNRLAEGKSELTGLLGGPTRSEKE